MANERDENIVDEVLRRKAAMVSSRVNWEGHWEDIAQLVLPEVSGSMTSNGMTTPGAKRTQFQYDSTAAMALSRFAAILDSLLTPRNSKWHTLQATDPELNKSRAVKLWFEEATRLLFHHRYASTANFAGQNQKLYQSLGAFGTGVMFIDAFDNAGAAAPAEGLRYKALPLGECYILENHQGIVDTMMRVFPLTARQAMQRWGEKVPETIREKAKTNMDANYTFVHCVKPRIDADPNRLDSKGLPFASYYVSVEGKALLQEGGYNTFPAAISRYDQSPSEVYGRSPAMTVLPAIKTLNQEKKTVLKAGHRQVDPVLLTSNDGIIDQLSLRPGAINKGGVNEQGRALVQTLPVGNIQIGKELMDDEREVINDAFLVTLFQILVETPVMTATEVIERTREKGILLAPTIGRQQSEYLGPLIEREIDILVRQRLLPPLPPELVEAQGDYQVEYTSPLSRVQRAEEITGFLRSMESILTMVNVTQDPSPLDFFNMDVITPAIAEAQAVPAVWIRPMAEVQQIRTARAEQAAREEERAAATGDAALMNAESKAVKAEQGK